MVEYYQLAHNVRHAETGRPVAEVIHSFGRADELERDDLVRLCKSIARVCGVEVRDPLALPEKVSTPEGTSGLPEGVKLVRTLELGVPLVTEALWERLGIGPALRKVMKQDGCGLHYERALLAMTANRLCEPESKLGVWDRCLSKVHMPSCQGLKLHQMYEGMDVLHRHIEKISPASVKCTKRGGVKVQHRPLYLLPDNSA